MDGTMNERTMKAAALREAGGGLTGRQERLQAALSALEAHLGQLEQLLSPVLREQQPSQLLQAQPQESASMLAAWLQGATQHVEQLVRRTEELLNRVDL